MDKLDSRTFDDFLGGNDPFSKLHVRFDLTGINLVSPSGMVQLVSLCYLLSQKGKLPTIFIPNKASIRTYLMRLGFVKALEGIALIDPPFPVGVQAKADAQRGLNQRLLEVTKIDSVADLPALLAKIFTILKQLKYKPNDAYDAVIAISECCQNIFDHNKNAFGFIALQTYKTDSEDFTEIGIVDCADGLKTSLRRNPNHTSISSDLEALRMAIKLGVSEYDDQTRGTGLFHLLEIAEKHRGFVQIRSGIAKIRVQRNQSRDESKVPNLAGVQITLKLPSKIG